MNLKDTNLSLQFYNYLCDIIGSPDVVKMRRDIFTWADIFKTDTTQTVISSGSKAEGLDVKGSDYDQMFLGNFIRVYESLNDVQPVSESLVLNMETNDTKPGFTKIKLVHKSDLKFGLSNYWCETVGNDVFISSKRFREYYLSDGCIIHGPCQTTPGGHFDQAMCFRCKEWISPAQQWIHRSRTAWPNPTIVTSAVQYGVLFVPIGCKNSPNEDLQWRISFSVTEKLLIHTFSHTQLLCYALLKIILKDIIKPKHGELLCSYFLKTIMFWLSEEISPSEWKPANMIYCFLDCIRRLIYNVEHETCLHYFIPENNLFEDRFTDNEHKALLDTLRIIYESPWTSVFETSTFQNYRLESVNLHGLVLSASELSCYSYKTVISSSFISQSIYSAIKRLLNVYNYLLNRDMCKYMICVYSRECIQSSHLCNLMARNKSFYQNNKRIFSYFKMNLRSDSISSWLLIASLFYKCKRFQECLVIINYSLSRCTPEKIHLRFTNSLVEQSVFKEVRQRWGLLFAFKHLIIENVSFRHPFCLLPDELIPLTTCKNLRFPPGVYSYLLQFLCCYQCGDYRGKHNALHDLELTIRELYFIFTDERYLKTVNEILDVVKPLL